MVNNIITKEKWLNTINTYFTGYYMHESERIKRRNYRALYLSNNDYLKSNRFLNNTTKNKMNMYNNWYLNYYHVNVNLSKNNNVLPN